MTDPAFTINGRLALLMIKHFVSDDPRIGNTLFVERWRDKGVIIGGGSHNMAAIAHDPDGAINCECVGVNLENRDRMIDVLRSSGPKDVLALVLHEKLLTIRTDIGGTGQCAAFAQTVYVDPYRRLDWKRVFKPDIVLAEQPTELTISVPMLSKIVAFSRDKSSTNSLRSVNLTSVGHSWGAFFPTHPEFSVMFAPMTMNRRNFTSAPEWQREWFATPSASCTAEEMARVQAVDGNESQAAEESETPAGRDDHPDIPGLESPPSDTSNVVAFPAGAQHAELDDDPGETEKLRAFLEA